MKNLLASTAIALALARLSLSRRSSSRKEAPVYLHRRHLAAVDRLLRWAEHRRRLVVHAHNSYLPYADSTYPIAAPFQPPARTFSSCPAAARPAITPAALSAAVRLAITTSSATPS